jgi:hypothetical protein
MAINDDLREQKKLQDEVTSSASEYKTVIAAAGEEILSTSVGLNEARKGYRGLISLATKVSDIQNKITRASSSELKDIKSKVQSEINRLKAGSEILKNKKKLTAAERAVQTAVESGLENEKELLRILDEQVTSRLEIEEKLGLTGIALDNLGRIGIRALGGIGVNLGALQGDFDQITKDVENLAGEKGSTKFQIFGRAIAGTGKIFKKVITDPAAVTLVSFDKLKDAFFEVERSSIAFQRLTGQTSIAAASINSRFATTTQFLETATALTEELGINVNNAFSPDTIAAAAEIQNTLGLSAQEAGKLALITQTTGGNFNNIKESIVDSVSAFNKVNKTAISQGVVLKDVSNVSEDILATFNGQTEALTEAAAAARRLGLDLGKLDEIAGSLLDFESSIDNELQAQLLTGKELNLTRARELALVNDLVGLGKELFDNSASLTEFSSMNRIAQEAQAKALGLSRQELAKIALQRSIELGLTNKNLEAAAGITAQDLERVALQDQLNLSIQKITQSLAGPAAFLASMVESSTVLYSTLAAVASIVGTRAVLAFRKMYLQIARAGAASAFLRFGLVGIPAIAALVAGAALVPKLIERATKVDDGIIGPDGGLVVSGPKGSYQLNSGDSVVAGTNLGGTPAWASELISAFREGRDVYMDGNKVSQQLAIGSFKSA